MNGKTVAKVSGSLEPATYEIAWATTMKRGWYLLDVSQPNPLIRYDDACIRPVRNMVSA